MQGSLKECASSQHAVIAPALIGEENSYSQRLSSLQNFAHYVFYEDTGAKVPSITILRGFLEKVSQLSPCQTLWRKGCLSTPSGKC